MPWRVTSPPNKPTAARARTMSGGRLAIRLLPKRMMDPRVNPAGTLTHTAGMPAAVAPQIGPADPVIGLEPLQAGGVGEAAEIFGMVDRIDSVRGAADHIAAVAIATALVIGCI